MIRVLDRADLVVVGAQAAGLDPGEVLDGADVGVLVVLEARLAAARSVAAAAAEALVTIAASRPFARGNRAAAWLAAAHLAALNGQSLDLDVALAVPLVDGAAAGRRDERDVARILARHLRPSCRRTRRARLRGRLAEALRTPERPSPPVRTCPVCRRVVSDGLWWQVDPWSVVPPAVLVRACVRQHGVHDRYGDELTDRSPDERDDRAPLVRGAADTGEGPAFVALTNGGPVLLRPSPGTDRAVTYDLFLLDGLALSGLVGSWDRLLADREPVAQVAVGSGPLEEHQADLDWKVVQAVGAGAP